ncbi:MAG: TatD family hydrolase [Candidatus Omnitrophica bacterium]|nr:TatD family hydrolase [Candidatus Omnitrophota bacterium]
MLVDTHCHINSLSQEQKQAVFDAVKGDHIFIDSSINLQTSHDSLTFSQWYPFVYSSLGFHPFSGEEYSSEVFDEYDRLFETNSKIVAIGEIGLDYKAPISIEKQEEIFRNFVGLSYRYKLPIVIHNRFNEEMVFKGGSLHIVNLLNELITSYEKVVFHCFSYGPHYLEQILKKGAMVSFSLNTLRDNKKIIESLKECPLKNLLFETDSPYMKIKKDHSTPFDINKVYERAAEIKNVSVELLKEAVYANAQEVFSLEEKV